MYTLVVGVNLTLLNAVADDDPYVYATSYPGLPSANAPDKDDIVVLVPGVPVYVPHENVLHDPVAIGELTMFE